MTDDLLDPSRALRLRFKCEARGPTTCASCPGLMSAVAVTETHSAPSAHNGVCGGLDSSRFGVHINACRATGLGGATKAPISFGGHPRDRHDRRGTASRSSSTRISWALRTPSCYGTAGTDATLPMLDLRKPLPSHVIGVSLDASGRVLDAGSARQRYCERAYGRAHANAKHVPRTERARGDPPE